MNCTIKIGVSQFFKCWGTRIPQIHLIDVCIRTQKVDVACVAYQLNLYRHIVHTQNESVTMGYTSAIDVCHRFVVDILLLCRHPMNIAENLLIVRATDQWEFNIKAVFRSLGKELVLVLHGEGEVRRKVSG